MTWSDSVVEQFSLVDLFTTDESDFYGPYNTLLFELFPANEHYQVSPQFKRITGSMDFTVLYIVSKRKVPVFFVEIKTYLALDKVSSRTEADDQMRKRFVEFASGSVPTPKLVGLSAMGTHFSIYELTTANNQLLPVRIIPDPRFLIDTAPKEQWSYDILDPAGEAKMREIVEEVKAMSVDLNP
ncbi:hypothetical protein PLEOSDRAFT_1088304 [Pleurotus ostreatus PC15]|uniref:Fungal-type protein kinase domain-containing protein n=2 Tax=Pleurotus TaxID=5320 RepID=A0A067P2Y1_PLEO1|nr:hypothetical protein CCMSSC00406_0006996 [Pleurotus cornucopiae]KDQ30221.1 hypothetical protein PLEOSDRAFT_1088304 [Pleurotus ostreatus PC15]